MAVGTEKTRKMEEKFRRWECLKAEGYDGEGGAEDDSRCMI